MGSYSFQVGVGTVLMNFNLRASNLRVTRCFARETRAATFLEALGEKCEIDERMLEGISELGGQSKFLQLH